MVDGGWPLWKTDPRWRGFLLNFTSKNAKHLGHRGTGVALSRSFDQTFRYRFFAGVANSNNTHELLYLTATWPQGLEGTDKTYLSVPFRCCDGVKSLSWNSFITPAFYQK
ncbi:hypothetical protein BDR07DRAFT_1404111 [Suillus spraguei]|nr:hypothetical protein BDR07DRAFT_1404111 [Suillus spraguei]